jgi:uncharacterized protein YacL
MPSGRLLPGEAASGGRAVAGSERDSLAAAPSRRLRAVVVPATVGAVLGLLLSTIGFIGVASKAMAITAWCIVALAIAWYVAYATGAYLADHN